MTLHEPMVVLSKTRVTEEVINILLGRAEHSRHFIIPTGRIVLGDAYMNLDF